MINDQRKFLETAGVTFAAQNSEVHFGFGSPSRVEMECPCELRAGRYDVERIGAYTYLGGGDTVLRNVGSIGRFCSIAPSLFAGPMEHRSDVFCSHPIFEGNWKNKWSDVSDYYARNEAGVREASADYRERIVGGFSKIEIGNSVWIGEGVFIRQGVKIGDGAIIASRSVVTKDVPPFAIVGGSPAHIIRYKFPTAIVDGFLKVKWWDYGLDALDGIQLTGLDINCAERLIDNIRRNIESNSLRPLSPRIAIVKKDGDCTLKE